MSKEKHGMAKVALITAYDNFAMGLRIMASCLQQGGHEVKVILFRAEQQLALEKPLNDPVTYHYYFADELRGMRTMYRHGRNVSWRFSPGR